MLLFYHEVFHRISEIEQGNGSLSDWRRQPLNCSKFKRYINIYSTCKFRIYLLHANSENTRNFHIRNIINPSNSIQSSVYDPFFTISNGETFPQDFLIILKHSLQNCLKILKKYFLDTICSDMYSLNYIIV